jgi:hypothetical protein
LMAIFYIYEGNPSNWVFDPITNDIRKSAISHNWCFIIEVLEAVKPVWNIFDLSESVPGILPGQVIFFTVAAG